MSAMGQVPAAGGRRFHVHTCLGRGGFGEVYRATMSSSGGVQSEVAVKILREDIDPGSEAVKRLRDEGRLLGALRHPAILHVHDLVLLEGRVALVTEFIEGEDLDRCMTADPPLPVRALVAVIGEVASALDAAWNSTAPGGEPIHLVHRDIKPANIRIGRHGEVKLLDFGIARATNVAREAHTAGNAMMGSYLYMAPERFQDDRVEPPSDVYALGCVLFEGLTRRRFFEGMTLKQIYGTMLSSRKFDAHLEARFKLLDADLPEEVVDLLRTLLNADPDQRPDAATAAARCEDLAEDLTGPTLKRWSRRREWPSQQVVQGSLDGRQLSAQTFVSVEEPRPVVAPEDAPPLGYITGATDLAALRRDQPREEPGREPPSAVPIVDGPPPVRPTAIPAAAKGPGSDPEPPSISMMALPSPGHDAFDAPTPRMAPMVSQPPAAKAEAPAPGGGDPGSEGAVPSVASSGGAPSPRPAPGAGGAAPSVPAFGDAAPPTGSDPPAPMSEEPEPVDPDPLPTAQESQGPPPQPAPLGDPAPVLRVDPDPRPVRLNATRANAPTVPRMPVVRPPAWGGDATSTIRPMDPMGIDELPPSQRETVPPARDRMSTPDTLDELPFPEASAYFQIDDGEISDPIPEVFDEEALGFDPHFEPRQGDNRLIWVGVGIGALAAITLVLAVGVVMGEELLEQLDLPAATAPVEPGPSVQRANAGVGTPDVADPAPAPVPSGSVDGGLDPTPRAVPSAPAPPTQPEPRPAPDLAPPAPVAPPSPAPPSPKASIERAWKDVDRGRLDQALGLFDEVLAEDPNNADALYGKGYTLMRGGEVQEATGVLCAAIRQANTSLAQEIRSIMDAEELSCP